MIDRLQFILRMRAAVQRLMALVAVMALVPALSDAAHAGEARVAEVKFQQAADGTYRFDVTVRHADAGWEHYADRWQVLAPDGTVLGERVLLHPHDTEQPFTRSLAGVAIPDDITTVTVRAHDKRHGWGGAELTIELRD
ncbi:hypothetical protein [Hoeflea sp.]|uniref:hypothetical protein n=1 Tax=Hoeflea sp. TaxID=1940281 RepID=UPI003BAED6C4